MKTKSVLFITYAYPPFLSPGTFHVIKVIRALVREGYKVTVLTADFSRQTLKRDDELLSMIPEGVEVIKCISEEYLLNLFLRKKVIYVPDIKILWYLSAKQRLKKLLKERSFDVIYSRAYPFTSHLISLAAKRMKNIPVIAHFSDPWVDSIYLTRTQRFFMPLNRKLEYEVIKGVDKVVFTTEYCKDLVMKKYDASLEEKAMVMPHGYDKELVRSVTPDEKVLGKMRMVYTGDFYTNLRTPEKFYEALAELKVQNPEIAKNIEILFVGKTQDKYISIAENMGLSGMIDFVGVVPYKRSFEYMASGDVLLIIDAASKEASPFLPSKLIEYLAFKKMILGITPEVGASSDVIKKSGGIVKTVEDVGGIKDAIKTCYSLFISGKLCEGIADDAFIDAYSMDNVIKPLTDVFCQLTRETRDAA